LVSVKQKNLDFFCYIVVVIEIDNNLVCYNLKATTIYIFRFNQNQNFVKNIVHIFQTMV